VRNFFGWNGNAMEYGWNELSQILLENQSATDLIMNDHSKAAFIARIRRSQDPEYIGISRADFPDDEWRDLNPRGLIDRWEYRDNNLYHYWPNEPQIDGRLDLIELLEKLTEIMLLAESRGLKFCIGNFSVPAINQSEIDAGLWDNFLVQASRITNAGGGVVGFHDYTSYLLSFGAAGRDPRLMINPNTAERNWPTRTEVLRTQSSGNWHIARWVWLVDRCAAINVLPPQIVITEGLWDRMPNYENVGGTNIHSAMQGRYYDGQRIEGPIDQIPVAGNILGIAPEQAMIRQMGWYQSVMPPYVRGVNLFTLNYNKVWMERRSNFGIRPAYIGAVKSMFGFRPVPLPEPEPPIVVDPHIYLTIRVDVQNVRSGPNIQYPVTSQLIQGSVRVVTGINPEKTWFRIAAGWVFRELVDEAGVGMDIGDLPVVVIPRKRSLISFSTHHDGFDNFLYRYKPTAVLTMAGSQHAQDLASAGIDAIHRFWPDRDIHETMSAFEFVERHKNLARDNVIVHTNNEPPNPNDPEQAGKLVNWHINVIRLSAQYGLRLCILNFGAGGPDIDKWGLYDTLLREIEADTLNQPGQKPRVAIGLHEYAPGLIHAGMQPIDATTYKPPAKYEDWPRENLDVNSWLFYLVGRYKHMFQYCDAMDILRPDVYITESGFDGLTDTESQRYLTALKEIAFPDPPWTHYRSWATLGAIWRYWWPQWNKEEAAFRQYEWAADYIYTEPEIKGILLFAITDDPKWKRDFDYSDAVELQELLLRRSEGTTPVPVPVPLPEPEPEPEPEPPLPDPPDVAFIEVPLGSIADILEVIASWLPDDDNLPALIDNLREE